MTRERLVLDTNVLISGALLEDSTPARALDRAIANGQLLASQETLRELTERLLSSKFDRFITRNKREMFALRFAAVVELVEVIQSVTASRDGKDDKFLEVAVNGRATVLVTGDKDLLVLNPFRGIEVMTPADFLRRA